MASDLVVPTTGGDEVPAPTPAPEPEPDPAPVVPQPVDTPAPIGVPSRRRQIIREFADARRVALASALEQARQQKPDVAATNVALADQTGLSPDIVARRKQEVTQGVDAAAADPATLAERHPRLAKWLSDPANASIAHDELPTLRTLDLAVRQVTDPNGDHTNLLPPGFVFKNGAIYQSLPGGLADYVGGFADLDKRLADMQFGDQQAREQFQASGGNFAVGFKGALASTLNVFGGAPDAASATGDEGMVASYVDPSLLGDVVRGAGGLAADLPLLVAGGGFGRLARGIEQIQRLGRFVRGAIEAAATSQPFAIREGLNAQRQNGDVNGAISWLIESAVPGAFGGHGSEHALADIAGRLAGDTVAHEAVPRGLRAGVMHLLREAGSEGTEEAVTELAHALHEQISGIDPTALDPDNLTRRMAVAGILGGVAGGAFNVPELIAQGALRTQHDAGEALAHRDRLQALADVAGQAKVSERSAARFDALVEELAGDHAPVYLQTQDWDATWRAKGVDPSKAAADAGVAREYLEARATGAEFAVPLGTFARQTKTAPELVDLARSTPGAPNAVEAKSAAEALPKELQAALEQEASAGAATANHAAVTDSAAAVGKQVAEQLKAAGTASSSADTLGKVYEHVFGTLAQRMGVEDAAKLFGRFGLQVKAKLDTETGASVELQQAAFHGTPHKFDRFNLAKVGTGEGAQAFGYGLYFTGKKEIAEFYRNKLARTEFTFDGKTITRDSVYDAVRAGEMPDEMLNVAMALLNGKTVHAAQAFLDQAAEGNDTWRSSAEFLRNNAGRFGVQSNGHVYRVEIPDEGSYLIDDKPLAEQPPAVREAIARLAEKFPEAALDRPTATGHVLYDNLVYHFQEQDLTEGEAQQEASRAMRQAGVVGIDYPADAGRSDGRNFVLFDDRAVKIVEFEQAGGNRRLGGFIPSRLASDGLSRIFLYEGRNLSTFLHESGHFFLEVLGDLAAEADAPASLKADYATVLGWFGVESRDQIETKHHERFARAFEAYLFEGKSPVEALRRVFARLRSWLVDVYKGLRGISDQAGFEVTLPDEIRQVFDRLVATDDEIAAAEAQTDAGGIFLTAEQAGMTPEAFAGYRRTVADAHERGVAKLQAEVLANLTEEQQAHMAEVREQLTAEVAADLDQQPVFRALAVLQRGETPPGLPPGTPPVKLSKEGLLAYMRPEDLASLPGPGEGKVNRGQRIYAAEGGVHPEAAAQLFGFSSGDELIKALRNAPDRKQTIAAAVEARMQARFPDPATPAQLKERAAAAVENDLRGQVLEMELAALNRLRRAAKPIANEAAARAAEAERQRGTNRLAEARQHHDAELAYEKAAAQAKLDTLKAEQRAKEKARDQVAKTMVDAFKQGSDVVPSAASFRAAAERVIADTDVRALNPQAYLVAFRKAGREAFEAAARGEYGDAFVAKQRELLNHELYRAAREAKLEAEKIRTFLKGFLDGPARERVGKAGGWEWTVDLAAGPRTVGSETEARALSVANGNVAWSRTSGYLEQIDALLERFDLKQISDARIDRRQTLRAWIEAMEAKGADVVIPDRIRDEAFRTNWRQMKVEELRGLHDAVKNIATLSSLKNKLTKAQKDRDFEDAVDGIVHAVEQNVPRRRDAEISGDRGFAEKAADKVDAFIAAHRKLSSYARQADGGEAGGVVWEHLVRPFNEAGDREVEMRARDAARLASLMGAWREAADEKKLGPTAGKVHIPAINRSLSLESRLAVALNWGNAGNRERLMSGERWSEPQVQAVLDTLDAADWKLVQGIWDQINAHWSEIAALEQRLSGVAPEKVEATPITTRYGVFAGGYYPVKYDPARAPRSDRQARASEAKLYALGDASRSTTRRGHLKERSEGLGKPLRLDLDVVPQHIAQVIHDLTHREAVRDANKLLGDDRVAEALQNHLGRRALEQINGVVKDIAVSDLADNAVDRALRWARSGVSIATMGFNLGSALMQVTGYAQSAQLVGAVPMLKAIGRIFGRGGMPEGALAFVHQKSSMMRHRTTTMLRESTEVMNQVRGSEFRQNLNEWAYYLMQRAQTMVDLPTWIAAYDTALEKGREDTDAVAIADQSVIDAQGAGQVKDLSGVQRSRITSLFTVYYHFFSTTFQRTAESWASARRADWTPEAIGRLTLDMLYLYVIPAAMTVGLRALRGAGGGDDKKDQGLLVDVTKETLANAMGTVIGLRDLSTPLSEAIVRTGGKAVGVDIPKDPFSSSFEYRGPAGAMGFAAIADLLNQAEQGELDKGLLKAAVRTSGIWLHMPTAQALKTVEGFAAMEQQGWTAPVFGPTRKR